MNFLAHLYLSRNNENLLIGNFIADFIRNKELKDYPEEIQKGVILHRQIDSYTDNHPQVLKGTRRLHQHHHKYAPVVIDILYDHILANNWSLYSNQSLDEFATEIYEILNRRKHEMPFKLQKQLSAMITGKWLQSYKTKAGLLNTLQMMDKRTAFPSIFTAALEHMEEDYELLNEEFNRFFPELILFVEEQIRKMNFTTPQSEEKQ